MSDLVTCEPEVKVSITPVCTIPVEDINIIQFYLEQCMNPKITYRHGDSQLDIANKVIATMMDQLTSIKWTLDKYGIPSKKEGAK